MKKPIILCTWLMLFAGYAFGQTRIEEELFDMLQQGKYKELVNKVCSLREKAYYKNAFMDYCLAYGYCQLQKPSISAEWFDHLLASYNNLSVSKRNELKSLKQSCLDVHTSAPPTKSLFGYLKAMSAEGFEGNNAGIESKMGIPSLSDKVEAIDFEHLTFDGQHRRFTLQQKASARKYYQDILGNADFVSDTTPHFLVFYPPSAMAIQNHIKQLEEYYNYYSKTFNLQQSDRLITVFYCTSRNNFNRVADSVHKLPVPNSTYGYASSVDLVMLGIANAAWLGAMKHELFHLMIRSYVGDIPPWLDEGTACFFESSTLNPEGAKTNFSSSNYRFSLLQRTSFVQREIHGQGNGELVVPTVQQLTNFNWLEFTGKPGDLTIKASYHQSLSYAFVSFLSEKDFLPKLVKAYRNRSYSDAATSDPNELVELHIKTNDQLLYEVTGMKMDKIQEEFLRWCNGRNIRLF